MRREFGAQVMDKNLLQEDCSRLKAQIDVVEGTMKETLESVDKLQEDLGEANASMLTLKNWAKGVKDQVAMF